MTQRWSVGVIIAIAAISVAAYSLGWLNGVNAQIDSKNRAAQAAFDERCRAENLFVSGSFDNWSEVYLAIKGGTFEFAPVGREWVRDDRSFEFYPDPISEPEMVISFADPTLELVLRDPVLTTERSFIPLPSMADAIYETPCIWSQHRELDQWINSYK